MTDNLPPLPKPDTHCFDGDTGKDVWSHSAEQMQAYARAAIEARAAVPSRCRDLTTDDMDKLASAVNRLDAGDIGWHALVDEVLAIAAAPQPVAQPSERKLPERDQTKPAEQQGVFRKFDGQRVDGSSAPGGKHHGCEYFVLDVGHDPVAQAALAAYADAVEATHPALAVDMRGRYGLSVAQAKPEQAAQPKQAACEQTIKKELPMLSISDEQAEAIASEVYARNPVDGVDAAFKLDWELVRAGISHAEALNTDDSCPHGNAHIVHDCLRCGAPVCCGKCCADDAANEPDAAGEIAYQLTKKLVIDMPTARAAVDAAIAAIPVAQPLTPKQRRALIDAAGDTTDGLNQGDFADEIVRAVERHHGIAASTKD